MAQTYGLAIIPWSPLGGGLLTGKYKRGEEPPEGARFADQSNPIYRRRLNDRIYDVVEGLQPIAEEKGITLSQLALGWVHMQPAVTAPIIGPRTMEQIEDNLKAVDVTFEQEELRSINRVIRRGESVAPFYEADFGPHRYR
jgi:aryl-alcohol dehydrogenase-like predicted oxidoreductase